MRVPVSWLREFVEVPSDLAALAQRLTLAGLEVEEIILAGLPLGADAARFKVTGLTWDPETIVVGAVVEVMPHPNADRLVLCRLDDGRQEHTVLTGAPNLFPFKGQGPLPTPLKVAYAREGAELFDGHQAGWVRMTLQRATIRGVESYSMACSEKELGISEEHEGVILLDEDAPVGMPLVEYMGDAVLDIALTPNMARNASILGVAREVAACLGKTLCPPSYAIDERGPAIAGRVALSIGEAELNPRFVLGLVEGVKVGPSPYWVQRRLRLAGMRPINNIVDATNYVMLEIGQPLHAFDFDALEVRAGGKPPHIHTRRARAGEQLTTLDEVERTLDDFTVLVCDDAGALSIAGVMGGAETEVGDGTRRVLLEGAAWNYINIRRTLAAQRVSSEAAYRFSRGVHPAMAERGVRRGLSLMGDLAGGTIAGGLLDAYPLPPAPARVDLTVEQIERALGVRLSADEIAEILTRLEFDVHREGDTLQATAPDHRLDIGEGLVGLADLTEEIARIYGYDRIPETMIRDPLPPQVGNPSFDAEEGVRDLLAGMGLQEVITYRLTAPERDQGHRLAASADASYVTLANPIASDRTVMRRELLPSVLEVLQRNVRNRSRQAVFEIGAVYLPVAGRNLPEEPVRLAIALTGPRHERGWQEADQGPVGFFDLKGILEALGAALHLPGFQFEATEESTYHPGKCSRVLLDRHRVGVMGELHPLIQARFDLSDFPVAACELDLGRLLAARPTGWALRPVAAFPPVLEDLAVIVTDATPAERVEATIRNAAGDLLAEVRLFDLYRGAPIEAGHKSLAYALTYQAPDRTLTDAEVRGIRERIVANLAAELGARLRS
ncbi:MAG TPA: phenylalanine--tRNA ligase subunit beta [Anaerolineales bacterium]|nr:phenylalanine--tRNA ligase subunit beta [Anaerolineales bacterium]